MVQAQIANPEAFAYECEKLACYPKLRPKDHELAPVNSPTGTRYHIQAKGGWVRCQKHEGSGSGSSAERRLTFTRIRKAKADKQQLTAHNVLGKDDDSQSHVSRVRSDSDGE